MSLLLILVNGVNFLARWYAEVAFNQHVACCVEKALKNNQNYLTFFLFLFQTSIAKSSEEQPKLLRKTTSNMGSNPLSALPSTKPTPLPTQDQDDQDSPSSKDLLSFSTDSSDSSSPSSSSSSHKAFFIILIFITCIALSTSFAFAFLYFSSKPPTPSISSLLAQPLSKLNRPVVLLVSSDGFRFGYQFKVPTPHISRLIANGTEAEAGLIPVFSSLTFPNHYSIATDLYPAYHGIINNHFSDPISGEAFYMGSHDPKWWLGEPLWETVVNNGLKAATYFWPGSEGHKVGADDPEITEAVARIDTMMGRLIRGLEQRGVFDDVSIIMVGDHGMVGTCDKKLIFLDDSGKGRRFRERGRVKGRRFWERERERGRGRGKGEGEKVSTQRATC
ncbi:hypothetical protein LR48_Vigan03g209500 [Vigna angularis]|uniref:Sulfatase N-terminal domain-containing protein n=1 Tax=Phaseolus angularis TaxID=3914 RepID=A0A0L9U7C8_PHAAN|nr:hypothetical protein LR48_Vigan03g209500 [Vigna angularis]